MRISDNLKGKQACKTRDAAQNQAFVAHIFVHFCDQQVVTTDNLTAANKIHGLFAAYEC